MKSAPIRKLLLATCAIALCAGPASAQSEDLKQLRNNLAEMQAQLVALQEKMAAAERKLTDAEIAQAAKEGRTLSVSQPLPINAKADAPARTVMTDAKACDSQARADNVYQAALGNRTSANDDALNKFAVDCLGLVKASQYKAADVAFTAGVAKNDGVFEIAPSYTVRYVDGRPYSLKYSASIFADPAKGDGNRSSYRTFGDALSGTGFGLGFEWATYARLDPASNVFADGIVAARKACFTENLVDASLADRPVVVPEKAAQKCEGEAFTQWLRGQGATYWASTLGKLYAADAAVPKHVAGLSFKKSWRSFSHLTPQIIAGFPVGITADALSAAVVKSDVEPWLAKLYFGGSAFSLGDTKRADGTPSRYWRRIGVGAVASLTYREEFEIDSKKTDQTLCGPAGAFSQCSAFNLAGPRKLSGFIPAVTFNFALPRGFSSPPSGSPRCSVTIPSAIGLASKCPCSSARTARS